MLAMEDEPLILADGTKINPANGKAIRDKQYNSSFIEIPSASIAQEIVAKTRRSVRDLPVAPQQMNALSLVCFYTMWGLSVQDIAIQVGATIEQIQAIKKLPEYKTLHSDIFKSIMETEANDIRGFFQQKAHDAAGKIYETMNEEGALGFAAAKDILDRAGHRPADVVEHRHRLDNSLQIEFINKQVSQDTIPVIDAEFEVLDG